MTRWLGLILLLALPARAPRANGAAAPLPSLTTEQMRLMMHTYVQGEKHAFIPFGLTGIATITAGGLLLGGHSTVGRGAAWPLLGFGAVELLASTILLVRTDRHQAMLDALLTDHPVDFTRLERAHLFRIQHRFQPALLAFEGALLAAGGTMAGVGGYRHLETVEGVGLGLAVQGLALFLLDWAVLDRAQAYSTALDEFRPAPEL